MISVSTTSLKEHHDAVNAVQQLADSGILNIELGADHNYPVDEKRIIQMKKEFGLSYTVHAFFPPTKEKFIVNIGTGDKEKLKISLDVIKNSLEFVNEAEAKLYSMHPGFSTSIDLKGNPLD